MLESWKFVNLSQDTFNIDLDINYAFASEAPGATGLWQKRTLAINHAPRIIYDDMLATGLD